MKQSAYTRLAQQNFLTCTARLGPASQKRVHDALMIVAALRRPRLAREAAEAALTKAAKR